MSYFVGLDLGQPAVYTALAVVELANRRTLITHTRMTHAHARQTM
jgi:hypothetical protein